MSKYECPECCGEGFELEILTDSGLPAQIACKMCEAIGFVDGIEACSECKTNLSECDIDLDDPYYEDIIEWIVGPCCQAKHLLANDICSVQPMTGQAGKIVFTGTGSLAGNTTFTWNGQNWAATSP